MRSLKELGRRPTKTSSVSLRKYHHEDKVRTSNATSQKSVRVKDSATLPKSITSLFDDAASRALKNTGRARGMKDVPIWESVSGVVKVWPACRCASQDSPYALRNPVPGNGVRTGDVKMKTHVEGEGERHGPSEKSQTDSTFPRAGGHTYRDHLPRSASVRFTKEAPFLNWFALFSSTYLIQLSSSGQTRSLRPPHQPNDSWHGRLTLGYSYANNFDLQVAQFSRWLHHELGY